MENSNRISILRRPQVLLETQITLRDMSSEVKKTHWEEVVLPQWQRDKKSIEKLEQAFAMALLLKGQEVSWSQAYILAKELLVLRGTRPTDLALYELFLMAARSNEYREEAMQIARDLIENRSVRIPMNDLRALVGYHRNRGLVRLALMGIELMIVQPGIRFRFINTEFRILAERSSSEQLRSQQREIVRVSNLLMALEISDHNKAKVQYHLARIHYKIGDYEQAQSAIGLSLWLHPSQFYRRRLLTVVETALRGGRAVPHRSLRRRVDPDPEVEDVPEWRSAAVEDGRYGDEDPDYD